MNFNIPSLKREATLVAWFAEILHPNCATVTANRSRSQVSHQQSHGRVSGRRHLHSSFQRAGKVHAENGSTCQRRPKRFLPQLCGCQVSFWNWKHTLVAEHVGKYAHWRKRLSHWNSGHESELLLCAFSCVFFVLYSLNCFLYLWFTWQMAGMDLELRGKRGNYDRWNSRRFPVGVSVGRDGWIICVLCNLGSCTLLQNCRRCIDVLLKFLPDIKVGYICLFGQIVSSLLQGAMMLDQVVEAICEAEIRFVSAERIDEYTRIQSEVGVCRIMARGNNMGLWLSGIVDCGHCCETEDFFDKALKTSNSNFQLAMVFRLSPFKMTNTAIPFTSTRTIAFVVSQTEQTNLSARSMTLFLFS